MLLRRCILGLAQGYEEINNYDKLRVEPLLAVRCGWAGVLGEDRLHAAGKGKPLAGKSTLYRLETAAAETLADRTGMVETELIAATYRLYGLATVRYSVLEVSATVEPFEYGHGFSLVVHRAGKPRRATRS